MPDENVETYSDEVGLMYVSDYGYAASPDNWQTDMLDYGFDNNWMESGLYEWTITRLGHTSYNDVTQNSNIDNQYNAEFLAGEPTTGLDQAFCIWPGAGVNGFGVSNEDYIVRPTFYLKANVVLESGTGISIDPYRIQI